MSISRRVFMKSGGLALFSFGLDPLFLARAAFASYRPLPPSTALSRPVLVCLFQRGAVDGLNMIVPHGDPLYYRERPRIAVPATDVVDLDGYFGLHPRHRPRDWLPECHAQPLRCPGLHGIRHAGSEGDS